MNSRQKFLKVASIIILILICITFTRKTFQNDTFYTIKIGKSILKNGIDMKDHYSFISNCSSCIYDFYDICLF